MTKRVRPLIMIQKVGKWTDIPRDQVSIIIQRNSAERIVDEWKRLKIRKSIEVKKLINIIDRQMDKPIKKYIPMRR